MMLITVAHGEADNAHPSAKNRAAKAKARRTDCRTPERFTLRSISGVVNNKPLLMDKANAPTLSPRPFSMEKIGR